MGIPSSNGPPRGSGVGRGRGNAGRGFGRGGGSDGSGRGGGSDGTVQVNMGKNPEWLYKYIIEDFVFISK